MTSKIKRTQTGIKGFDSIIDGGLPKNSITLVSGAPGTGKSIFAMDFAFKGASKFNETTVYVSFEQPMQDIKEQAAQFGWDFDKYEKNKKLHLLSIPVDGIHKETLSMITEFIKKYNAKRLVIDSLSTLSIAAPYYLNIAKENSDSTTITKFFIYKFIDELRLLNCTCMLVGELKYDTWLNNDTIAEFVVDNVVVLKYFGAKGASSRTLAIKKARKTKFNENIHPISITKKGIQIEKVNKVAMKF